MDRRGALVKAENGPLCVRGPIFGPSGYARYARNVMEALHVAGKEFWVDPLFWAVQPSTELPENFNKIMGSHTPAHGERERTSNLISVCLPQDLPQQVMANNTWNMSIFETTRVPEHWIKILNFRINQSTKKKSINGLIVPCQGNVKSFEGASMPIKVIPLAIDYDIFTPDGPVAELEDRSDFNIMLSYAQNMRKNPDFVIRLINELDSNTTVYLKTFGVGMSTWEREIIRRDLEKHLKTRCRVVLLYDLISDEDQAALYRAMDLVVNVAHAEGWDLPRIESYACGTPAIGPCFMGPDDYTIDEFRLIEHNLVVCPEIPPFFNPSMKWAELDLVNYLQVIQGMKENWEDWKEITLKQRAALIGHTGTLEDMGNRIWDTVMG